MSPVTAILGDSREKLRELAESSVDACVTDPPYALEQMTKRYGSPSAKPCGYGKDGSFRRLSRGFMGMAWDTGSAAFDHAFWKEVLRVLKPGAHLLAFGGTRTYHRLACAIEDAGFEIRDAVMWHYGSGFPKSLDVSKAIDKVAGVEREVVGSYAVTREFAGRDYVGSDSHASRVNITAPATDAARQWEGWGTALKPSTEIICLARKPLSEPTVAANVLRWGTGALNIGASRVVAPEPVQSGAGRPGFGSDRNDNYELGTGRIYANTLGRWPANLIHDGSEEVMAGFPESVSTGGSGPASKDWRGDGHTVGADLASATGGFGDSGSAARFFYAAKADEPRAQPFSTERGWNSHSMTREGQHAPENYGDNGSVARFFYTAKADADDRIGSKHPTVKPVDLMQYLVRLVCPRGGLVIDPFAGSGSTGEACIREGMRAILIEREPAYFADIERRIKLAMAGPDERAREIVKAQGKTETTDGLPLFGGAA